MGTNDDLLYSVRVITLRWWQLPFAWWKYKFGKNRGNYVKFTDTNGNPIDPPASIIWVWTHKQ